MSAMAANCMFLDYRLRSRLLSVRHTGTMLMVKEGGPEAHPTGVGPGGPTYIQVSGYWVNV